MTATPRSSASTVWYPMAVDPTEPGLRLVTIAPAGTEMIGIAWRGELDGIVVCPMRRPGREPGERPLAHMDDLIEQALPPTLEALRLESATGNEVGTSRRAELAPWAIYGHSLGALVAWELVQAIRECTGHQPLRLIVSGCPAPHLVSPGNPPLSTASDETVIEHLRALGGTPHRLLDDPTLRRWRDHFLRLYRADMTIRDTWEYRYRPPLTVPITMIAASADPRATIDDVSAWTRYTTSRANSRNLVHGGHAAPIADDALTRLIIVDGLRPWLTAAGAGRWRRR